MCLRAIKDPLIQIKGMGDIKPIKNYTWYINTTEVYEFFFSHPKVSWCILRAEVYSILMEMIGTQFQ